MSRIVPAEELNLIEQVISEHLEGIGISALEGVLATSIPNMYRRTLQRRLKRLVEDGRIISEGESIALVYQQFPPIPLPSPYFNILKKRALSSENVSKNYSIFFNRAINF